MLKGPGYAAASEVNSKPGRPAEDNTSRWEKKAQRTRCAVNTALLYVRIPDPFRKVFTFLYLSLFLSLFLFLLTHSILLSLKAVEQFC